MNYKEVTTALISSLSIRFNNVYHSAELITVDDKKIPAVPVGDEWLPLDPADHKELIYIRRASDDEVVELHKVSACSPAYKMRTLFRIVCFKDHAEAHNEILSRLMKSVLISFSQLKSITRDKFKLEKEEGNIAHTFGASTFYGAVDVYLYWHLMSDTCVEDFCATMDNPVKNCTT